MITTEFLSQLGAFNLIVRKRVTSSYTGARRSVMHGRGISIKDYRIYSPGDDFRQIDWKIFARTDDLYIKRYEEDKSLTTHVIIDRSASMNFGAKLTKFDYASMIGVGIAYLALKENEKFKFSTFGDDLDAFDSKRSMGHLLAMVDHLNAVKLTGFSKFRFSLQKYKKQIDSQSLIVIVSDFLFSPEELEEGLVMLGRHDMKLVQVLDPLEKNFSLTGDYDLKDSETKELLKTYVSLGLQTEYKRRLESHITRIAKICDRFGVSFHSLTTDKPIFDSFFDILNERNI